MAIKITEHRPVHCPECKAEAVVKYGTYKGVQRYWCKICQKKFKADDTLFHMKLDANMVSTSLNLYYEGTSISAIRRHLSQEFEHAPSTATIYEWIQKFSQYATDSIKDYHPKVGDVWIADETVLRMGGQKLWLFDIIDSKTRYLLATRLSRSRTTGDAQMLMNRAIKTAGKAPKEVITDKLPSYLDVNYGEDAEHRQGSPFHLKETGQSTSLIERFHGSLKGRTKVMRGLKNFETAHDFTQAWLVHYNYLRPHEGVNDKTPAEAAGIKYPYDDWQDIIRNHKPSKPITIEHQPRNKVRPPAVQIGRPHKVRTSRKAKPASPTLSSPRQSRGDIHIGKGSVMGRRPFQGSKARRGRVL